MSFKDDTEFNMLTGKKYKSHPNHVKKTVSGVDLIKSAAVYGANGSGKSNLVNAILFLKELIDKNEETGKKELKPLVPLSKKFKIDPSYKKKPTSFRIEFESKKIHYDYGLELFQGSIIDEWLYIVSSINKKDDEKLIFHRKKDKPIIYGSIFKSKDIEFAKGYEKKLLKLEETFISIAIELFPNDIYINNFHLWFKNLKIINPYSELLSVPIISNETKLRDFTCRILCESKTGINNLKVKEIPLDEYFGYEDMEFKEGIENALIELADKEESNKNNPKYAYGVIVDRERKKYHATMVDDKPIILVLKSIHINDIEFDLDEESDGTNRLLDLTPAIFDTIYEDVVVIIDEIERSMHPILAKQILDLYLNKSKTKSQLIFTTHESNLLDLELFRQDEIWFVEKKENGSSEFYSLSDFGERFDKDIRKGYLQGRYGAIPFMANLADLNWE